MRYSLIFLLLPALCFAQSEFVVLTDSATLADIQFTHRLSHIQTVTLTKTEWLNMKRVEKKCIEQYNKDLEQNFKKAGRNTKHARDYKIMALDFYKIQYIPYVNEQGEKEIFINGFCSSEGMRWKRSLVFTDDGGNCYFSLRINLSTGECLNVSTNGYG